MGTDLAGVYLEFVLARILHVIASADPEGGGPIEGIRQIAKALEVYGHEIHLASCDPPDAPWLSQIPLKLHPLGPARTKYGYTPRLIPWLLEHGPSFDAVIVNGIWQYNSLATRKAMRKLGRPYVVFTHGMLDPYFKRAFPLKHLKKWLYWPWGEYRNLRDAAAVLFTCEDERVLARQSFWLYKANERVVNYGTAGPGEDREGQVEAFLSEYPHLRDRRFLLFLSRIHPKKGCDLLIKAFARVAAQDPELRLVIAGPDQVGWQAELMRLAKSLGVEGRIDWTGMLAGDKKWGAFHACEAFVLPSHQENFGIVVAEALACSRPALITDRVNIWREIKEDGAGLVGSDTEDSVAAVMAKWLQLSESERAAMGQRARACFEKRFQIENAARSLLDVLTEVQPNRISTESLTANG